MTIDISIQSSKKIPNSQQTVRYIKVPDPAWIRETFLRLFQRYFISEYLCTECTEKSLKIYFKMGFDSG